MNPLRSLTAGILAVGLLAGTTAFAQGGPDGPAGRRRVIAGGPGIALRGLDLTEAQEQQVREIRERHRDAVQQAATQVREAAQAQRKAVEAVPLNEGVIRSTTFALAEAQTEAAVVQARIHNEVWSVLTDAQRAEAEKRRAEREARAAQRGPRRAR
jgi:protein CpxP